MKTGECQRKNEKGDEDEDDDSEKIINMQLSVMLMRRELDVLYLCHPSRKQAERILDLIFMSAATYLIFLFNYFRTHSTHIEERGPILNQPLV